jgi:predicted transcriptional regulator
MRRSVNSRALTPCEVAAKELLPTIRSMIAERLVNERHMSIYAASKVLSLTPAAVSNYVKCKRGNSLKAKLSKSSRFSQIMNGVLDKMENGRAERLSVYYCMLCVEGRRALNQQGYDIGYCFYEASVDPSKSLQDEPLQQSLK